LGCGHGNHEEVHPCDLGDADPSRTVQDQFGIAMTSSLSKNGPIDTVAAEAATVSTMP